MWSQIKKGVDHDPGTLSPDHILRCNAIVFCDSAQDRAAGSWSGWAGGVLSGWPTRGRVGGGVNACSKLSLG